MTILNPRQSVRPDSYGSGLGPSRPVPDADPIRFSFKQSGLNISISAEDLTPGESPDLIDVRLEQGTIAPDFLPVNLGTASVSASSRHILGYAPYETQDGRKRIVRFRPQAWDRWDGASWLELPSSFLGYESQRLMAVVMQDKLVAANGRSPLIAWDGVDNHAVAVLSADAPIAQFVTRIGNRLVAASIKPLPGSDPDPYLIAYSADGDMTNWTSVLAGAGAGELAPQGPSTTGNFITGLSAVERALVIYRQRSIVLGLLTGLGSQPFRFTTVDFSHGTKSPYSIANGGLGIGDFYLGSDYMPYLFDGNNPPVPIGHPIVELIRGTCTSLKNAVGFIDDKRFEFCLCFSTGANKDQLNVMYAFNIREWTVNRRLQWRRRNIGTVTAGGFGAQLPLTQDPIVDTVASIVDTVNTIVDSFADVVLDDTIVFGDVTGQSTRLDPTQALTTGVFHTLKFGHDKDDITIDTVRLDYRASGAAQVGVSVTADGGQTYSTEVIYNLVNTGNAVGTLSATHAITGNDLQLRLRFPSGFCYIHGLKVIPIVRGPSQLDG